MKQEKSTKPVTLQRRAFIKTSGAVALTAVVPMGCGQSPDRSSRNSSGGSDDEVVIPTAKNRFLTDDELITLNAFVDRMIPGQPEDANPGAVEGCCALAIDYMLAAFESSPPLIYAGSPFSDRGGHPVNRFEEFTPLDSYEELAWRIAIEGSQGLAAREFNGPVKGYQDIYREGLARLNELAQDQGRADFASATAAERDAILMNTGETLVQELIDIGFPDTLEAMYGPPEYGGNCDLVGWDFTAYDGDVQPRGYTADQVVNADSPGAFDSTLPPSYHQNPSNGPQQPAESAAPVESMQKAAIAPLPAIANSRPIVPLSAELMSGIIMAADGRLSEVQKLLRPYVEGQGLEQVALVSGQQKQQGENHA